MKRPPALLVDGLFRGLAIVGFVLACISLYTAGSVPLEILAISLSLLALSSTAVSFLLLRRLHQVEMNARLSTRWGGRLSDVSNIVLAIANAATSDHDNSSDDEFQPYAADACLRLANAFENVTGKSCRVILKQLYFVESGPDGPLALAVRTLALSRGVHIDESPDWVKDNTDFESIFEGSAQNFFSNDLPADLTTGYRNSHWTPERLKDWAATGKYPYRSTIVWPVRALTQPSTSQRSWSTVGFLCVDSPESDAFDPKLDIEVGEIVAHAFYGVFPTKEN